MKGQEGTKGKEGTKDNPQPPIPNRQSSIVNRQFSIVNPQSPIRNPQSPIPNPQSPIVNRQSSIELIPNRLLFDFAFPLPYRQAHGLESVGFCTSSGWTDAELLPPLSRIDNQEPFAPVWACWNEDGLFIACEVCNKKRPLRCDPNVFWKGDNLRLCTDMRDARQNKRATRFCQQFFFLPVGGGPKGDQALAGSAKIHRAREDAPLFSSETKARRGIVNPQSPIRNPQSAIPNPQSSTVNPQSLQVASKVFKDRYTLQAHIPAACLVGFDPVEHQRIGFYYILEDRDHGQQFLTVGDDFNWHIDPSTWATAVLAR
ncbi:MAG: hypothetical protein V3W34_06705 [Phycisphaerae bacterium]